MKKEHIRGLLQAKTDWVELAYGGRFVSPIFGLGIEGKSINHFNLAGDLKAGELGPLDVSAVYQNTALSGKNQLERTIRKSVPNFTGVGRSPVSTSEASWYIASKAIRSA